MHLHSILMLSIISVIQLHCASIPQSSLFKIEDKTLTFNTSPGSNCATLPNNFDHIAFMVDDLDQSIEDFQKLGFSVSEKMSHVNEKTYNALIRFEDQSYLELISFKEGSFKEFINFLRRLGIASIFSPSLPPLKRRFYNLYISTSHKVTYALKVIDSKKWTNLSKSMNQEPFKMTRVDGNKKIEWEILVPEDPKKSFYIHDLTSYPRASIFKVHPNGIYKISQLCFDKEGYVKSVVFD